MCRARARSRYPSRLFSSRPRAAWGRLAALEPRAEYARNDADLFKPARAEEGAEEAREAGPSAYGVRPEKGTFLARSRPCPRLRFFTHNPSRWLQ